MSSAYLSSIMPCRGVAKQVDPFESKGLKPDFRIAGSRVELKPARCQAMGKLDSSCVQLLPVQCPAPLLRRVSRAADEQGAPDGTEDSAHQSGAFVPRGIGRRRRRGGRRERRRRWSRAMRDVARFPRRRQHRPCRRRRRRPVGARLGVAARKQYQIGYVDHTGCPAIGVLYHTPYWGCHSRVCQIGYTDHNCRH
jgi:hypothetical protein